MSGLLQHFIYFPGSSSQLHSALIFVKSSAGTSRSLDSQSLYTIPIGFCKPSLRQHSDGNEHISSMHLVSFDTKERGRGGGTFSFTLTSSKFCKNPYFFHADGASDGREEEQGEGGIFSFTFTSKISLHLLQLVPLWRDRVRVASFHFHLLHRVQRVIQDISAGATVGE